MGRHCSPGEPGGVGNAPWRGYTPSPHVSIWDRVFFPETILTSVCVCRRRAVLTGVIDFPTTGICRIYPQPVRFLLRDFSASCCTTGSHCRARIKADLQLIVTLAEHKANGSGCHVYQQMWGRYSVWITGVAWHLNAFVFWPFLCFISFCLDAPCPRNDQETPV